MKNPPLTPAQILAEIARIQSMEVGKLSEYSPPGRSKDSGPYHKLQAWVDGKNQTRHVRPEELPDLQEALAGFARFRGLTDQYAELIIARTRSRREQDVKKKIQPYSRHSRRKSTESSSPS
jgi:hypothetical protein